jgi:hypothetical protein
VDRRPRSFVARRPVHPGDWDVVHSEVDAEVRAVVDQVVESEHADHGRARQGEEHLAGLQQRPRLAEVLVGGPGDRLARGRDVSVEEVEDLAASGQRGGLVLGAVGFVG